MVTFDTGAVGWWKVASLASGPKAPFPGGSQAPSNHRHSSGDDDPPPDSRMGDHDVEWLESMLPGLEAAQASAGKIRAYKEESYLTELCTPEELRGLLLPSSRKRAVWDALT